MEKKPAKISKKHQKSGEKSGLTPRQEIFCREYLVDLNATQAAIRAGYSEKTAYSTGPENVRKPGIAARIAELQAIREDELDRKGKEVIKRLWEIADLQLTPDVGVIKGGLFELKDTEEWSQETRRVVRSVETTKTVRRFGEEEVTEITHKVRAPEAVSALTGLMKHYGLASDFNQALQCLRKYGLCVAQDGAGNWIVKDENKK
jgi:phage terminase small subunit